LTAAAPPFQPHTHLIVVAAVVAVISGIILVICIHCLGHQRAPRRAAPAVCFWRRCCL
jgi:hypothetical protein